MKKELIRRVADLINIKDIDVLKLKDSSKKIDNHIIELALFLKIVLNLSITFARII